jgi:hypothetical protein
VRTLPLRFPQTVQGTRGIKIILKNYESAYKNLRTLYYSLHFLIFHVFFRFLSLLPTVA